MRWLICAVAVLGIERGSADACDMDGYGYVQLERYDSRGLFPTLLPANPVLVFFPDRRDPTEVTFRIASNGVPVPFRVTAMENVMRVEVQFAAGPLAIHAHAAHVATYQYLVSPFVRPERNARVLREACVDGFCDPRKWLFTVRSEAPIVRIEWDDGVIERWRREDYVFFDRGVTSSRGRGYRIVGQFLDGSRSTLFESVDLGADVMPPELATGAAPPWWLFGCALAGSVLLLLRVRSSAVPLP